MKTSARRVGGWSERQHRAIDDLEDRAAELVAADRGTVIAGKAVLAGRDADHGRGNGAGDAVHVHVAELARLDAGLEDGGQHAAGATAGLLELKASRLGKLGRLDLAHEHEVELARLPEMIPEAADDLVQEREVGAPVIHEERLD